MAEIHDNEISTSSGATVPDPSVAAYSTGTYPTTTGTAGGDTGSKTDEAKQKAAATADQATTEAANVKDHAVQAAGDIKQQAVSEISTIKDEALGQAKGLAAQAKDKVSGQVDTGTQQVASFLSDTGRQLRSMAENAENQGTVTDVIRQIGDRVEGLSGRLENGGYQSVLNDVQRFARNKPGVFLAAAAGAGFLVGRMLRNTDTQQIAQAVKGDGQQDDYGVGYGQDVYSTGTYTGGPATPSTADAYAASMASSRTLESDELAYGNDPYAPSHNGGGLR